MNLLLDIGNSRCKYCFLDKTETQEFGAIAYTNSDIIAEIGSLLQNNGGPEKVVICSVLNNEFNQKLIRLFDQNQIVDYYFLNPAKNTFGIQLCYQNPECLGADRLVGMIAAHAKYKGNKCIVDCGTAVTIDAMNQKGEHQGGVIMPGISSMQQALSRKTEIANSNQRGSYSVLPSSTQDAIYSGCISAVAGGIEYVVNTMQKHSNSFDKIIMTGGDATVFLPMLAQNIEHEPKLVLSGLTFVLSEL